MPRLENKVAFITGAGGGIGRQAAILFAKEGAKVAVADINAEGGAETVRLVEAAGGEALFCETDVTDEGNVQRSIAATVARFGGLDILYNNAGGSGRNDGSVVTATNDEFWRVIKVDLFGTWLCCRYAIPEMIKRGGGSVINTLSHVALVGMRKMSAYASAKGGVAALTRTTAVEFGDQGVRCNALAPSVTKTDRVLARIDEPQVQELTKRHLVGLGEPIHVAYAALFLASPESAMVTGQILPVDSGVTIT